ncbi:MAG: type II secretion system protein GspN [Bdellovibrionaceae bacterium]|nr:type II secretion system protein GspN [Bdellovibrio sp.]
MDSVVRFFRFLNVQKWKILLTLTLVFWFIVLLFPFNDLNDLVTSQISKLTDKNIFVQFDKLSVNPFLATVTADKVYLETPQFSNITSERLTLTPSITALLASKPGGKMKAEGFLKGEVEVSLAPMSKSETGAERSRIEMSGQNISLKEFREMAGLSFPLKGQLQFSSQANADLTFTEQPEVDINMIIKNFELPPASISLPEFGRMNLPEIKLALIELKGRLAGGKFLIETGKIGTAKDEFYGDVKGDFNLTLQNVGGQVVPVLGAYNISLDLRSNSQFKERAKFYLGFLDGYKTDLPGGGAHYKFRMQAAGSGMTPQFTPLR